MKKILVSIVLMYIAISFAYSQSDPSEFYFIYYECKMGNVEEDNYKGESRIIEKERKSYQKEILNGDLVYTSLSSSYIFTYKNNLKKDFDIEVDINRGAYSKTQGISLAKSNKWADGRIITSLVGNEFIVIFYNNSRLEKNLKSYEIPSKLLSSNGYDNITIRRYDNELYFFLNKIFLFTITDSDINNTNLKIKDISHFGYQVNAGKPLKINKFKYTPFESTNNGDSYFFTCNSQNIISSSFKVPDNKENLPFYDQDKNKLNFNDIIDKNKINILFFTKSEGLEEVEDYISENILNWQLKFNASVKTILIDARPVQTSIDLISYWYEGKKFSASELYYCPMGQYIHKTFDSEWSDEDVFVAYVNEESYLHCFLEKNQANVNLISEVISNSKNNIYYFEENEDCWYLTSEKYADYSREIIPKNGGYELNDYYLGDKYVLPLQMKGFYFSLYPAVKNGKFIWYHKNGNKDYSITYNNDIMNGPSETYFNDGNLASMRNYKNGKLDGLSEEYHANGNLFIKNNYKDGKLMNILEHKDDKGNKLYSGTLANGNGTLNLYDDKCMFVTSKQEYKNGVLDGPVQFYFLNGKEQYRNNYIEGKFSEIDFENALGDFGRNMIKSINEKNIYHIRDYIILPDMKDSYGDAYKMKLLMALNFIDYSKPEEVFSKARSLINYDPLKLTEEKFLQYKNNTFNGQIDMSAKVQSLFSFMAEKYNGEQTYSKITYSEYKDFILKCHLYYNTPNGEKSIEIKFKNCMFGWILFDIPGF